MERAEQRDHELRAVAHEQRNTIPPPEPALKQRGAERGDLSIELGVRQRVRAVAQSPTGPVRSRGLAEEPRDVQRTGLFDEGTTGGMA